MRAGLSEGKIEVGQQHVCSIRRGSEGTVVRAKHQADRFGSLEIDPEHILLALLDDPVLIGQTMQGISEQEIIETINAHLPRRERNPLPHDLELSRAAREALILAEGEADKLSHRYIGNGHLPAGVGRIPG
jgi:ATP-dependent Clp protease ATP-binding subunit ClpA